MAAKTHVRHPSILDDRSDRFRIGLAGWLPAMSPPPTSVVEIDFLGLTPAPSSVKKESQIDLHQPLPARRGGISTGSSIRGIQKAVSRMDPDVLRSLIAATPEVPILQHHRPPINDSGRSSSGDRKIPQATWINTLACRSPMPPASETPATAVSQPDQPATPQLAPLTIFYDGGVSVFDVPPRVADLIIKTAETGGSLVAATAARLSSERAMAETLASDAPLSGLPLARKKSLRRFLEKRQQRLTSTAPYSTAPSPEASSSTASGDGEVVSVEDVSGDRGRQQWQLPSGRMGSGSGSGSGVVFPAAAIAAASCGPTVQWRG